MRKTRLLLAIAVLATPLVWMPHAKACSCIRSDPRDRLHQTDGAFIGTYTGREPVDPTEPYGNYDYIFDTERVFKGDVGDVVEVRAAENGAACGLEYSEGQTGALFLRKEQGVWHSSLCDTVNPDLLKRAARPFPQPNAKGPPRLLVGGSFGEVRVMALDRKGRTAGYGYGEEDALHMSLCPGAARSIEVAAPYGDARPFVDVRRVRDLEVTRTIEAPARWKRQNLYPTAARCISKDGDAIVFGSGGGRDGRFGELLSFANGRTRSIEDVDNAVAALGDSEAYVAEGRKLVAVDYATGDRRPLHRFERRVSQLSVSPDGEVVAALTGVSFEGDDPPARTFVVRTRDGDVLAGRAIARRHSYVFLRWINPRRLLYLHSSGYVLDRKLQRKATIRGASFVSSAAIGCRLYSAGYGAVTNVSACRGGEAEIVRTFFSPVTNAVVELPKDAEIKAPPRRE